MRWRRVFGWRKGEIVIQIDSDSFIDPANFKKIIEPFENSEIGAVSVHTDPKNADKNFLTKMQAAYYFMSFRILKAAESTFLTVFCCSGCASAYRKQVVMPQLEEWIGETFLGLPVTWGDDRALTSRILKAGYKTIYSDRVTAETIVPENFRQLVKQQVRWKKSWFVNAIYNAKFIWKTQPFVTFSYYFPLIAITFLSPIMAVRAILYLPIVRGIFSNLSHCGIASLGRSFCRLLSICGSREQILALSFSLVAFQFVFLVFFDVLLHCQNSGQGMGNEIKIWPNSI